MKYLAIIATRDFAILWQAAKADFLQIDDTKSDNKLLIWQKDDELSFSDYKDKIEEKLNGITSLELGVIFHKLNGDVIANAFRESLRTSFNSNLAFCEWYSANQVHFWDEANVAADKSYNNLKKAWKDSNGDKGKTFEAVWNYFYCNSEEEILTENIFNVIYDLKDECAVEKALRIRDKYFDKKSKS